MRQRRSTKQRQMILDIVNEHRDHPSADEIYLEVRTRDHKISRGTVYRNLNLLVEDEQIKHVKLSGADRFDWQKDSHYHMICVGCGKLTDLPITYRNELDFETAEKTGYENVIHRTIFEGICSECKQNK